MGLESQVCEEDWLVGVGIQIDWQIVATKHIKKIYIFVATQFFFFFSRFLF